MSSSRPLWPRSDSMNDVDVEADSNAREPVSFFGQLFHDTALPVDENEECERTNEDARCRRIFSSEENNTVACTTPTKTRRAESPQTTPGTEKSSHEESSSEAGSPFYGTGVFDLSSMMKAFTTGDLSHLPPQVPNNDSTAVPRDDIRRQQQRPDFSLRDTEVEALLKHKKHMSFFAYGRYLTIASIVFALTALALSVVSKHSMSFVELEHPVEISPQLDRKSTRLNSSHLDLSRMPSSA